MLTRFLVVVGVVLSALVLCYAIFHLLVFAGATYVVNKMYPTPQPPPLPATILPAGYRGVAIICAATSASPSALPQQASVQVSESGVVRVAGVVPPTRWVYSDTTPVSFTSPPTSDATSIYATYAEHYVKGVGTVWIICVGNRPQHQLFEPQESEVFKRYESLGCPADFDPPHENVAAFQSTTTPVVPKTKPPP
jgi:hypothetical protein